MKFVIVICNEGLRVSSGSGTWSLKFGNTVGSTRVWLLKLPVQVSICEYNKFFTKLEWLKQKQCVLRTDGWCNVTLEMKKIAISMITIRKFKWRFCLILFLRVKREVYCGFGSTSQPGKVHFFLVV